MAISAGWLKVYNAVVAAAGGGWLAWLVASAGWLKEILCLSAVWLL